MANEKLKRTASGESSILNLIHLLHASDSATETIQSLGSMKFQIPIPNGSFLSIQLNAISENVPLLLGLDVLYRESLIANNVTNESHSGLYCWSIPLQKKFGHLYLHWSTKKVLFTKRELVKVSRHFHHPSRGKPFELAKRARHSKLMSLLESYSKNFHDHLKSIEPSVLFINDFASVYRHPT